MSEITPALTAEQWAEELERPEDLTVRAGYACSEIGALDTVSPIALVALANAALPDDDPRKITRADVEALAAAVFELPESGAAWYVMTHEQFALVSRLPVKLAALLPPETL